MSSKPHLPQARAPHTIPAASLARRLARACLVLLPSLGAAGLLPGLSAARADERISARLLPSPESGSAPGAPSQGAYAVPGIRNDFRFGLTCYVQPTTGWCPGGQVVAQFMANPGQKVVRAWTARGAVCVVNDWYLACPIDPAHHNETQEVTFLLDVEPWSYAVNNGFLRGTDGLPLPQTPFSIEMRGRGALRIGTPQDMVIPETADLTQLPFVNDGPSTNRGVTFRFGPFPKHLAPRLLGSDLPCTLTPERVLQCGPVDQGPDTRGFLMLSVQAVPPLPPLPDTEFINATATSDLTPYVATDFMITIVPHRESP